MLEINEKIVFPLSGMGWKMIDKLLMYLACKLGGTMLLKVILRPTVFSCPAASLNLAGIKSYDTISPGGHCFYIHQDGEDGSHSQILSRVSL